MGDWRGKAARRRHGRPYAVGPRAVGPGAVGRTAQGLVGGAGVLALWGAAQAGTLVGAGDNDSFVGNDRDYTSGFALAYIFDEGGLPGWFDRFLDHEPGFLGPDARRRIGVSLAQQLFTPENLSANPPPSGTQPYAALLYGTLSVTSEDAGGRSIAGLELGVVGPAALGEETQRLIHDVLGYVNPQGWDFQVPNQPLAGLFIERAWRTGRGDFGRPGGMDWDFTPFVGLRGGLLESSGHVGVTLRVGAGLDRDSGPPGLRPAYAALTGFKKRDGFAAYGFLRMKGRGVGNDVTLDGAAFRESSSARRRLAVGEFQGGVAGFYGPARVTLAYTYRTRRFESQENPDIFGSLTIGLTF